MTRYDMQDAGDVLAPDVHVQLSDQDGNAFSIIGRTVRALKQAGYRELAEQYRAEAMGGDYDNVLQTTMRYVSTS